MSTPNLLRRAFAIAGIARGGSTTTSVGLQRTASASAAITGKRRTASLTSSSSHGIPRAGARSANSASTAASSSSKTTWRLPHSAAQITPASRSWSQRDLLRIASACDAPAGCPTGQIMPKLRMLAARAVVFRSRRATRRPRRAASQANARPRIPPPTTITSARLVKVVPRTRRGSQEPRRCSRRPRGPRPPSFWRWPR